MIDANKAEESDSGVGKKSSYSVAMDAKLVKDWTWRTSKNYLIYSI